MKTNKLSKTFVKMIGFQFSLKTFYGVRKYEVL